MTSDSEVFGAVLKLALPSAGSIAVVMVAIALFAVLFPTDTRGSAAPVDATASEPSHASLHRCWGEAPSPSLSPSFASGASCVAPEEPAGVTVKSATPGSDEFNHSSCELERTQLTCTSCENTIKLRRAAVVAAAVRGLKGDVSCSVASPAWLVSSAVIAALGIAVAAAALIRIAKSESESVQMFSDHCMLCLANTEEVMEPMVHVANPRPAFTDEESLRDYGTRGKVYQLSAAVDSESTASLGFNQTTSAGMSDIQLRDAPPTIVITTGASDFDLLLAQASHLPHALADLQAKAVRAANVRIHGPQPAAAADHARGFGSWAGSVLASPAGSPNKGASRPLGELPPVPDHAERDYPEYPMYTSVNDTANHPPQHAAPALQSSADGHNSAATDEDSEHLVQTVSDLGYAPWSRSAPHITPPHGPASASGPVPEIQVGSPMPGQALLPGQVDALADGPAPSVPAESADNVSKSYLSAFVAWNDGNEGGQSHSTSRTTSRAVSRRSSHMSEDSTASSTQRRVSRLSDALKAAQSFRSSSRRASAAPAGFTQDSPNGPGVSFGPIASESECASASSPCNVSPLAEQADRSHSGPFAMSGNELDEAGRSLLERLHDVVTFDLKKRHGATLHCAIPQLFEAEPLATSTEPRSFSSSARKSPKRQLLQRALRRQLSESEIAARRYVSQLFLAAVLHIVHMYDGQVAKLTATSVTATWNAFTPFPFFEARAAKCAQHIAQTLEQLMIDLREGVDLLEMSQSPQSSPGHTARGWQADLSSPGTVPVGDRKRVGEKYSDQWAVGVAAGPLLVGYSGTEQQCAPSLIGPSLTFAQQLVALGVQTGAHVVVDDSCLQGAAQHGLVYPCDVVLARVGPRIVFELSFATALRGDALQRLRDAVQRLTAGATQIASCNYKAAQEPLLEAVRMLHQSGRGPATRAVLRHCKRLAAIAKEFDAAFAAHEKQADSDDGDASKASAFVHYARKMPGWFLFEHRAVRFVNELLNAGMDLHGELPRVSGNTPAATETSWASTPQSGILLAAGKTPGTTAMSPSADAITRQLRGYMQRSTKPGGSSKEITIEPAMATDGSDSDDPMEREDTFMTHEDMRSRRSRSRSVGSQLSAVSAESYDDTECSFTPRGDSGVTEYKDDHGRRWRRSQRRLGAGTFGEVFLGLRGNGELVAIKCIPLPPVDGSPESPHVNYEGRLESFASEIRALTTVRHANVVSYLSSFIDGEDAVVVMEYVPGGSLTQLVQRFGPPPMAAIRGYLNGVLSGLMALHRRGIVHCDLSTSNVLVGGDGAVKLTDFGCSVAIGSITHSVSGTPAFMAPEACNGSPGKASDIWSFGVVVLFLLTGRLPYGAAVVEEPAELVRKVGLLASDAGADDAANLTIPVCREAMLALTQERPESVALASPVFGTEAVTVLEFSESESSDQVLAGPLSTLPGAELPLEALLAASLAESCLVVDASKRPTAEQLLRHGFFFQT